MILKIIKNSVIEQLRNPLVVILSLITAPLFVMLYAVFFPSEAQTFNIAILNNDSNSVDLVEYMGTWSAGGDEPTLIIQNVENREEGIEKIKSKEVKILLTIPENFMDSIKGVQKGDSLQALPFDFVGDLSDPLYSVTAIMTYSAIDSYSSEALGIISPLTMTEEAIGKSGNLNELDYYIPGLLIFSLIILIFQVAMSLSGLVEGGIIKRLKLTKVSTFEILFGYSSSIIVFGIIAFYLTLLTAKLFGSTITGDWLLVGLITLLTAMAITGAGMIVSAFSPTVSGAFIISNFPLMLFMFFSGAIYPIGKVEIFNIGKNTVGLFDILPTTHAVNALHELLVFQGGIGDVAYEVLSLTLLTVLYVFIGVKLYYKKHISV